MGSQGIPEATAFNQQMTKIAEAKTDFSTSGGDAAEQYNAAQIHCKYQSSSIFMLSLTFQDGDAMADSNREANSSDKERKRDGKLDVLPQSDLLN